MHDDDGGGSLLVRVPRGWERLRLNADHYPETGMLCMFAMMAGPNALPAPVWRWTFPVVMVVLALFTFGRKWHSPYAALLACCVSRWPRYPVRYMQRRATVFAVLHWLWEGYRMHVALASYMVLVVTCAFWLPLFLMVKSGIGTALMLAPIFILLRISTMHRRIVLFCPTCNRGPGGDDDDSVPEPEPDPAPVGTKELQPA